MVVSFIKKEESLLLTPKTQRGGVGVGLRWGVGGGVEWGSI